MEALAARFTEEMLGEGRNIIESNPKETVMDCFLSGKPLYDSGPYYDYDLAIRFENKPPNLLLISGFSESDKNGCSCVDR